MNFNNSRDEASDCITEFIKHVFPSLLIPPGSPPLRMANRCSMDFLEPNRDRLANLYPEFIVLKRELTICGSRDAFKFVNILLNLVGSSPRYRKSKETARKMEVAVSC